MLSTASRCAMMSEKLLASPAKSLRDQPVFKLLRQALKISDVVRLVMGLVLSLTWDTYKNIMNVTVRLSLPIIPSTAGDSW
jgi:hypothetical protein